MFEKIADHICQLCQQNQVIPVNDDFQTVTIVTKSVSIIRDSQLGLAINRQINTCIWPIEKFDELWSMFINKQKQNKLLTCHTTTVIQLIDHLLITALNQHTSDIHFEPYNGDYQVRFRIDGVLHLAMKPDAKLGSKITTRLKVMACLDIAEKRLPQDGQLLFFHNEKNYVMRMSTLPVSFGEKIVLRIIKQYDQLIDINHIGLTKKERLQYINAVTMPQGLIIVCGPTGSGKTVTLYSGLNEIDRHKKNVCCVEDPIEIPLEGVNQTQINNKSNLTFATVLRAFLRQDPDVIMIGEIRDQETAHIAIQAAHTGHLVLSTLHTNSSCEAIFRLNQMGIANYLLASGLKLIISQRLLRLLCPHCKNLAKKNTAINIINQSYEFDHYEAQGCKKCTGGYQGRTAIYEFLIVSPAMTNLLFSDNPISINTLEMHAKKQGMRPLHEAGIALIKQGLTSFAELIRVTNTTISDDT